MKTIQILTISLTLLSCVACSKNESGAAAEKTIPTSAPIQQKSAEMLPNEIKADDLSGNNVAQDNSGKKVIYWEDAMVAGRHFSKPGKSPFMEMELTPKYAN